MASYLVFSFTTPDSNENLHPQVLKVITQFSSLQPVAIRIQRKKADSSPWEDWQYFARNCSVWGMKDNEDLENPNSVNCLQLPEYEHLKNSYFNEPVP